MALNQRNRKAVIFGRKKAATDQKSVAGEDDDTLDMLLHYAKAGMESAEQSLKDSPDVFSKAEKEAFEQNKNMLEAAPFLIDTYKTKMTEYNALHKKMLGILTKCEEIVAAGDEKAKEEIKVVLKEASVLKYDEDGNMEITKAF